jgi:membrane protein DedA with SNARE-associated domain
VSSQPRGMAPVAPRAIRAVLTAVGAALWDAVLLCLGWCLGSKWRQVTAIAGSTSNAVLAVALVALVGLETWWWRRRA